MIEYIEAVLNPNEYITYLERIFISALYDMPRAGELGLSNYAEVLAETETYLRNHGVSYDYLASPYGKAHALPGLSFLA